MNFAKAETSKQLGAIAKKSRQEANVQQIINIPNEDIVPNPKNETIFKVDEIETLAEDIKLNGFKGAIEVVKLPDGKNMIQAGHRRFAANKLAGKDTTPCIIVKESRRRLISDNTNIRVMDDLEIARCIIEWEEILEEEGFKGNKRAYIAKQMHMSEGNVHKHKAVLKLIPELQNYLLEKKVPFSVLSPLATWEENEQKKIYDLFEVYLKDNQEEDITREAANRMVDKYKNKDIEEKADLEACEIDNSNSRNLEKTEKIENKKSKENKGNKPIVENLEDKESLKQKEEEIYQEDKCSIEKKEDLEVNEKVRKNTESKNPVENKINDESKENRKRIKVRELVSVIIDEVIIYKRTGEESINLFKGKTDDIPQNILGMEVEVIGSKGKEIDIAVRENGKEI